MMDRDCPDANAHKRKMKRSLVLLAAKMRAATGHIDVRLRNLSQKGALLEADVPPSIGDDVVFERGDTVVKARVAWVSENRFGIEFLEPIEESEVLVHVGRPTGAPSAQPAAFRRTGLRAQSLTPHERTVAAAWVRPAGRAD